MIDRKPMTLDEIITAAMEIAKAADGNFALGECHELAAGRSSCNGPRMKPRDLLEGCPSCAVYGAAHVLVRRALSLRGAGVIA